MVIISPLLPSSIVFAQVDRKKNSINNHNAGLRSLVVSDKYVTRNSYIYILKCVAPF